MHNTSTAVVFEAPRQLMLRDVGLPDRAPGDCVVEVDWSGISTGTERLLWDGTMPPFPGLAYPLVPGYESVGRVIDAGNESVIAPGTPVFIPGSRGFTDVHGIFGGAARHLVVDSERLITLPNPLQESGVLLALAATAHHAVARFGGELPELIVGHGVLGRLIARLCVDRGGRPVVWESKTERQTPSGAYDVRTAQEDGDSRYTRICDASGNAELLDDLIGHLHHGGTLVLAGFYPDRIHFDFAPAFMREISLLIAAEWQAGDLDAVQALIAQDRLQLDDLITHRFSAPDALPAYETAFTDPSCLKLILDWRNL